MSRALAPLFAVLILALAGCASAQSQGCGAVPGQTEAEACRLHDLLIQIYQPGSRPPGW
jgi:type IV pilus biogenesis protein CpaD/CtpE